MSFVTVKSNETKLVEKKEKKMEEEEGEEGR